MKTSTLISSVAIALSVSSVATADLASFGTLSYGSTPIAFNTGNSIGNNGFWYSNTDVGGKALTLGMKSISYFGTNAPVTHIAGDTWEAQAGKNTDPRGSADAPTWNFIWSVTVDGAQPNANDNLYWSMRITGPNGNWGTTAFGMAALSGDFPNTPSGDSNPVYQNAWVGSFDFLQLSSAATSGDTSGLWDGLAFDPMANGNYEFELSVFERTGKGDIQLSTLTMTVNVVPSPGAIALLGVAGLASRRRRA
jgi:hypothetical protein